MPSEHDSDATPRWHRTQMARPGFSARAPPGQRRRRRRRAAISAAGRPGGPPHSPESRDQAADSGRRSHRADSPRPDSETASGPSGTNLTELLGLGRSGPDRAGSPSHWHTPGPVRRRACCQCGSPAPAGRRLGRHARRGSARPAFAAQLQPWLGPRLGGSPSRPGPVPAGCRLGWQYAARARHAARARNGDNAGIARCFVSAFCCHDGCLYESPVPC